MLQRAIDFFMGAAPHVQQKALTQFSLRGVFDAVVVVVIVKVFLVVVVVVVGEPMIVHVGKMVAMTTMRLLAKWVGK